MTFCPIINQYNCRQDCFFLRNGGCALVLAATISDANQKKINNLERKLDDIIYNQEIINSNKNNKPRQIDYEFRGI